MPKKPPSKEATEKSHSPEAEAKRTATRQAKKEEKAVKTEIMSEIRNQLFQAKNTGKTPTYQVFIKKFFDLATKDPNSQAGKMLANAMFSSDLLSDLDASFEKNLARDLDFVKHRIMKYCFKEQREVLYDVGLSKRICMMCSRRAGKTDLIAKLMDYVAVNPHSPIFYINLTFQNAINQTWDNILLAAENADLAIKQSSKADGNIFFENGSSIHLRGNSTNAEADKMRGYKAKLVIIDEAQSGRNMKYLVEDVIMPLTTDFVDSTIVLSGTPPRMKKTYFEKCWLSPEWKNHHWTMLDNPFIPDPMAAIQEICTSKGLDMDSPLIQREYLGQLAYDTEAQVFKDYKTFEGELTVLPNGDQSYSLPETFVPERAYIGVDFGFTDYNAVIGIVSNITLKQTYVAYIAKFNKSTVTQIIESARQCLGKMQGLLMKNPMADISGIQIFCDTSDKQIAYEMSQTYGMPAYPAYKYDKSTAIAQLVDEARTGRLLIPKESFLEEEMEMTLYKRSEDDTVMPEIDDELYHPDAIDALLYASRSLFNDYGYDVSFKETTLT